MSAKLVKKGLELVLGDDYSKAQASKSKNTRKLKRLKKQKQRLAQGKDINIDHTETNLKYFIETTWNLKKETQKKILEHQSRNLKVSKIPEVKEEEDEWIFDFDLEDTKT